MNAADPGRSRRERSTGNRRKEARLGTGCNRREKTCCTNSSTTRSASTSLSMKVHQTVWHILFYRSLRGVLLNPGEAVSPWRPAGLLLVSWVHGLAGLLVSHGPWRPWGGWSWRVWRSWWSWCSKIQGPWSARCPRPHPLHPPAESFELGQ